MNTPTNSEALPRTNCSPSDYDAGPLNDFGGGDVGWWQDYLRAEIGRANDYWRNILENKEMLMPLDEAEIDSLWSSIPLETRYDMCRDSFNIGARMAASFILENVEDKRG